MAKKLYFGNLSWGTGDEELATAVSQYGQVISAYVVTDRNTGRSRGFGFAEVEDADAENIIQAMNGMELDGRPLTVNEARDREDRSSGFRSRR